MKNFFPIKLTGFLYIIVGLVLFRLLYAFTYDEYFKQRDMIMFFILSLLPSVSILIGIGILKKEKGIGILSLILLPIFWVGYVFISSVAHVDTGFTSTENTLFLVLTFVVLTLWVLTFWSIKYIKKNPSAN